MNIIEEGTAQEVAAKIIRSRLEFLKKRRVELRNVIDTTEKCLINTNAEYDANLLEFKALTQAIPSSVVKDGMYL